MKYVPTGEVQMTADRCVWLSLSVEVVAHCGGRLSLTLVQSVKSWTAEFEGSKR